MKKLFALFALAILTFVLAYARPEAASNTTATPTPPAAAPQDDAPRISLADAKKHFDAGTAVFFDARTEETYKEGHVKGAINVNFENWEKKLKTVPKDKTIITYCSCPNEHSAAAMVIEMQKKGVKNVYAMLGGTMAWKNAGYPMETGK